jgi:transposase
VLACNREKFDPAKIRRHLYNFYLWCADSDITEIRRLATTIETWWDGIDAFLRTGITNAKSEGINRAVKLAARNTYGFRNPENQRLRTRSVTNKSHSARLSSKTPYSWYGNFSRRHSAM